MTAWIELTPEQSAFAEEIARERQEHQTKHGARDANGLVADFQKGLRIHTDGARGECAVYVWLGGRPAGARWIAFSKSIGHGNEPDIVYRGVSIDIKSRAILPPPKLLIVRQGTVKPDWVYMLVDGTQHPRYRLVGWAWGREVATFAIREPVPGRPAHVIPEGHPTLKPCIRTRDRS